jgi:type I restriction enzyme S subunit
VRKGWEVRYLGDVLKLEYGKPLPKEDRDDDGAYPAYGANGVKCRSNKFFFSKPSIIVGRKGSAGEITLTEHKFWPLDVTYFVTFDERRYDLIFLYHCLKSLELTRFAKGVKPGLNRNDVYSIKFAFPSLPEQQRIVAILNEAFQGISAAVANAEKNLANARELFESYLNSVFSHKGEEWIDTCIGNQVMLQRGFDITKDQQKPGSVPVVSSGGVKSSHNTAMVKAPGVVIGRKGTLGKTFYLEEDFWPHDTTLWVKDFKGNDPRFVYYFFTALDVLHLDTGTANPALNRNQVHPIKIVWPPVDRQKPIADKFDALQIETQRLESLYQQKLDALAELKHAVLQKAFAGELAAQPEQFLQEAVA